MLSHVWVCQLVSGGSLTMKPGGMGVAAMGVAARLPALRGRVWGPRAFVPQLWRAEPRGTRPMLLSPNHKLPHEVVLTSGGRVGCIICGLHCKMEM